MPKSEATPKIAPLYALAKAALPLWRANDNNFHFLKLLRNGFEIPEYNGFNTTLPTESGVQPRPATHVTYMPLINMNSAEPDTMLTTVKVVKSQSEQAKQKYTVYNYLKYKP